MDRIQHEIEVKNTRIFWLELQHAQDKEKIKKLELELETKSTFFYEIEKTKSNELEKNK